jgi:uncharacterized protein related to proFAR isomerase
LHSAPPVTYSQTRTRRRLFSIDIVPVIDLLGGQVVHAKRGERDRYRPIESALTAGSALQDIVAALLALHPFRACYVADLAAIRGTGDHRATVAVLEVALAPTGETGWCCCWTSVGANGPRR